MSALVPLNSVCVCESLDSKLKVPSFPQGGNDSFGVHCPTKTAPLKCDIKRGRSLDVPASEMATRPRQKPGNPRVTGIRWNTKVSMNH